MSQKKNKDSKNIAKATGAVGIWTLASRVLGMLRDAVTWAVFANNPALTDAFYVAFRLPNLLRRLVAEGSLATAFVPLFCEKVARTKEEAQRALSEVLSFTLLLTATLCGIGILFAPQLAEFFAPGFAKNSGQMQLTVELMRIMFPYIILVSILALISSVLNTLGKFALPAAAPALLNAVIIVVLLCATVRTSEPVYQLSMAVLLGGLIVLIPVIRQVGKLGYSLTLKNPTTSPTVKKLSLLMLPAVLSASLYQIMIFINSMLASLLAEGSISYLYYADRLFQFPLGVFSLALATALLPALSAHAEKADQDSLNNELQRALRWITFITLPATVGLYMLAEPICASIYQWGNADAADTAAIAQALRAYSIGLWAISCQSIIVRTFIAKKNTKTPAIIATFGILVNCYFAIALMGAPHSIGSNSIVDFVAYVQSQIAIASLGHSGLALAGSIATALSFALSVFLLKTIKTKISMTKLLPGVIKSSIASALMGLSLYGIMQLSLPAIATTIIGVILGGAVYAGTARALKMPELKEVLGMVTR